MTFPDIDANKRNDRQFRNKSYPKCHIGTSPLELLSIDMINIFPSDYMHCVLLGVMRKLIRLWLSGTVINNKKCNSPFRLSKAQVNNINDNLKSIKSQLPKHFARKPRNIESIDKWKATELRLFILYIGKIVLKNNLSSIHYNNFLLLNFALALLMSEKLTNNMQNIELSRFLFHKFIVEGIILYGEAFPVYNVHSLLHLPNDAIQFKYLDRCSAFSYENYLQKIKKMVKGGKSELHQIIKKVIYESTHTIEDNATCNINTIKKKPPNF